jgi:pyruvate dehydrogenase E2 component (dihydrolipoamide acetyltransferase)
VDKKTILQLSKELPELAAKTRDRKTSMDDLRGGSFTVSNLGGIGGTFFTPIINVPEVAILGIGRNQRRPVYDAKGNIVPRDIAPLALGYDHRIIDGAQAARFVVRYTEVLENFEAVILGF